MDYPRAGVARMERSQGVYRTPDHIQKPRVSRCVFTRKWIVNAHGNRHACGSGSYKSDLAFRHWRDAMAEANAQYRDRVQKALRTHDGCQNRW